ncbi:unnamed protein product [Cochlearia groenlandica]
MKHGMCLVLLLTSFMMISTTVSSSSSHVSCTNVILSMAPCLDYITGNMTSSPSQQCCNQFGYVVRSSPECLCQVLKGGGGSQQLGFNLDINQTQALALPQACHVQTPPASQCNEHGNGSKTVPRDGSVSDSSSNKLLLPLVSLLYVVSYITFY